MSKSYYSLGLMSGTSMDGVDASIIQSDGEKKYKVILDKYFEYPTSIYKKLTILRDKIKSSKDLKKFSKEVKNVEKEITLFHSDMVNQILKKTKVNVDLIGFHGQTIYHNAEEKISRQLGDGNLLSKITKKTVVYNFRKNDIEHGGQGAPLTPIFHNLLAAQIQKKRKDLRGIYNIVNIGGITNLTSTEPRDTDHLHAYDIGPGNCLIDQWIRKKTGKRFDKDGLIARSGKPNKLIIKYVIKKFVDDEFQKYLKEETYPNKHKLISKRTFDTNDFDIIEFKNLSLKDGAASLTDFTAALILFGLHKITMGHPTFSTWIVCGGGRKNKYLLESITKKASNYLKEVSIFTEESWEKVSFEPIDKYGINGDFVESQAFAYLAIRSYLKLPITFPCTTGVKNPSTGGTIVKY